MRRLALLVASFVVVFAPAAQADAKPHDHGGNGVSAQRIDWD